MIADVFASLQSNGLLSGVDLKLGSEFINVNAAPPRIVLWPTVDTFRPGRIQTGLPIGTKASRSTLTRVAGLNARIWAKASGSTGNIRNSPAEVRAVEDLLRKFLSAVHQVGWGDYKVGAAEWGDAAGEGAPVGQYGRFVTVPLSFEIPIYATPDELNQTLTAPTEVQTTLAIPTDTVVVDLVLALVIALDAGSVTAPSGTQSMNHGAQIQFFATEDLAGAGTDVSDDAVFALEDVGGQPPAADMFEFLGQGLVSSKLAGPDGTATLRATYTEPNGTVLTSTLLVSTP